MTDKEINERSCELGNILGLRLHCEYWILFEALKKFHDELIGGENELP